MGWFFCIFHCGMEIARMKVNDCLFSIMSLWHFNVASKPVRLFVVPTANLRDEGQLSKPSEAFLMKSMNDDLLLRTTFRITGESFFE